MQLSGIPCRMHSIATSTASCPYLNGEMIALTCAVHHGLSANRCSPPAAMSNMRTTGATWVPEQNDVATGLVVPRKSA